METENKDLATVTAGPSALANWIAPASIQQGLELAKLMASAKLMPEHLRGDAGSCLLVLEQASRWRMSPFAVAQATAVVRGKLCFEGKLVAAVLAASGAIEGRLTYDLSGEGPRRAVIVSGTPKGSKKPCILKGTVEQWATENGNWKKDPDSMLIYRGTRQWARLYAPEAMLGVYTPDELQEEEPINITPDTVPTPATPEPPKIPPAPPANEPEDTQPIEDNSKKAEEPKKPAKNGNGNGNGKAPAHPAIEASRDLYRAYGEDRKRAGRIIDRVSKLYGGSAPIHVPPENLDALLESVKVLANDLESAEAILDSWEQDKAQGVA